MHICGNNNLLCLFVYERGYDITFIAVTTNNSIPCVLIKPSIYTELPEWLGLFSPHLNMQERWTKILRS